MSESTGTAAAETTGPNGQASVEEITDLLKNVIDPELGVNIVDLGLLYGLEYQDDASLRLDMTLTTAACPLQDVIDRTPRYLVGITYPAVANDYPVLADALSDFAGRARVC